MPRARTLKPDFFSDEEVATLSPLARLFFQGLWCYADRDGRLEDRPARLKVQILPYDDVDANVLLDEIAGRGFVTRYEADGKRLVQIRSFGKHQHPHPKEPASELPAMPSVKTENAASEQVQPLSAAASNGKPRHPAAGSVDPDPGSSDPGSSDLGVGLVARDPGTPVPVAESDGWSSEEARAADDPFDGPQRQGERVRAPLEFAAVWSGYPNQEDKPGASSAFCRWRRRPPVDEVMAIIARQVATRGAPLCPDDGDRRFVPRMDNWIRKRLFEWKPPTGAKASAAPPPLTICGFHEDGYNNGREAFNPQPWCTECRKIKKRAAERSGTPPELQPGGGS